MLTISAFNVFQKHVNYIQYIHKIIVEKIWVWKFPVSPTKTILKLGQEQYILVIVAL